MEALFEVYERITPSEDELKPLQKIKCSQPECTSIFNNLGNLEMHLERHHKISLDRKDNSLRLYFCPVINCIYRVDRGDKGKYFKNLKYLKQHYQKVHMLREFKCQQCGKSFITETKLQIHQRKQLCGKKFICYECNWSYDSIEALQTHGNRKGHRIHDILESESKKIIDKIPMQPLKSKLIEQMKTEDNVIEKCDISVQTDSFDDHNLQNASSNIKNFLRDVETQTYPSQFTRSNNESDNNSITSTTNYLDQMIGQSAHMYTQTCNDFLSELGLTDIQTQTNWPPTSGRGLNVQLTSTATSTNPFIYDELLVSTETQTSFTQCLLNSCSDVTTINANGNVTLDGESFSCLYNTQYTQTCGSLLDDFNFDAHDNVFMDGFHSTYTQT